MNTKTSQKLQFFDLAVLYKAIRDHYQRIVKKVTVDHEKWEDIDNSTSCAVWEGLVAMGRKDLSELSINNTFNGDPVLPDHLEELIEEEWIKGVQEYVEQLRTDAYNQLR